MLNTRTDASMGRICGPNLAAAHPHIAATAAVADAAVKRIATLPHGPLAAPNCGAAKGCGDSTTLNTAVLAAGAAGAAAHPTASTTSSTGSNSGCESEATAVSRERWQQHVAPRGRPEAATAAAVTPPCEQEMQMLSAVPNLSAVGACDIGGGRGTAGGGKFAPGFGPPLSVNPPPAATGWVPWGCVDCSGVQNPAAAAAATAAAASSVPSSRAQSLDGTHPTSAGGAAPPGPLPQPLHHLAVPLYPVTPYRYSPYARPWGAQSFGPVAAPVPVPVPVPVHTPAAGPMPTVPSAAGGCVRRLRLGTYYHPAALPPPCFSGLRPLPRAASPAAPPVPLVQWPAPPYAGGWPNNSALAPPGFVDDYPMVTGSTHAVHNALCGPHLPPQHLPPVVPPPYIHGMYGQLSSACGGGASSTHGLSRDGCRTDLICSGRSSAGGAEIAVGGDAAAADAMAATAARCILDGAGETDAAAASRETDAAGALQALAQASPAPPGRINPWVSRLPSSGGSAAAAAAVTGELPRNMTSQHPQFNSLRTAPVAIPAPAHAPGPGPGPGPVGAQYSALDAQLWQQAVAVAYPSTAWTSCRRTQYGLTNVDVAAAAAEAAAATAAAPIGLALMRVGSLPTPPSCTYRSPYDFRYGYECSYGAMYDCGSSAPDGVIPRATPITGAGVTAAARWSRSAVRDGDGDCDGDGGVPVKNSIAAATAATNNAANHDDGAPEDVACKSVHMPHQSMPLWHSGYGEHWPWPRYPKMPYMYEHRLPYSYSQVPPLVKPWSE
ncbi:hypothetical protein VaNZ11_002236 [Volvox africanus]|uniref:Uncharacterized protein n=1 Tax=Volvox africanus TaxID=51714 RepID=A0ABQ5RS87_9CHLO|nr:hypothetical protein VaNZ11_002236 [Volvox africanus]